MGIRSNKKVADSNNIENKIADEGNEDISFFSSLFKKKEKKPKSNMVSFATKVDIALKVFYVMILISMI